MLVQIDNQAIDRRYVDFAALAAHVDECIEKVEAFEVALDESMG